MPRSQPVRVGLWTIGSISSWIFFTDNFYEFTRITGTSMTPSLSPKYHETRQSDWVWWQGHSLGNNLQRGDVVRFFSPCHPERDTVKRIIALPGDTVILDRKRRPVRARDGADLPESASWDRWGGKCRVPEGHVWVEGDNWRSTRDSNTYGPISMSLVHGKAVQLVWPLKDFGTKPWEGFRVDTKVVPGNLVKMQDAEVLNRIFRG
ncbi:mitochondrial inner membrane protease subunit 2-like [Teratosphaeria destructans]|uniref:Mitochondrial inner membrane protease subunit n=1 Tax=Teratosphaeria destructans TaxID=418781 RepID=A0A9W7SJC3_9PEZI|nr:mitochondrial inner membrane protease subunit 2-like [Teratosphaeria destructans]